MPSETITAFSLEAHSGPYDTWPWRTRLFYEGRDTGRKVGGYLIEAQFSVAAGFLVVTSYDCPFEEMTHFYLLDQHFRIRGHAAKGVPYVSWLLKTMSPESEGAFRVEFYGGEHWRLTIRERRGWWLKARLSLDRDDAAS
jgi:hypothetical protein